MRIIGRSERNLTPFIKYLIIFLRSSLMGNGKAKNERIGFGFWVAGKGLKTKTRMGQG
jgi:hypothetical protein